MVLFMNLGTGVINMKKLNKILLVASIGLLASCSTISKNISDRKAQAEYTSNKYPDMFLPVRNDLAQGDLKKAITQNSQIANIKQLKTLNNLENARLLQLNGQYANSIKAYNQAINTIPKSQDKWVTQAKQILFNKDTYNYQGVKTPYYIPDYEIEFLYTYQALNYLKANNAKKALESLQQLDKANSWAMQQYIIANGMKTLIKKDLKQNDIKIDYKALRLDNFVALNKMNKSSSIIPNAYGNPMGYYLKAILEGAISKDYNAALKSLAKVQEYTVGNKYITRTEDEYKKAVAMGNNGTPFSTAMGRIVVFYEQGLVNDRSSTKTSINLGNIGAKEITLPIYNTKYNFIQPKKVTISQNGKKLVDTYTETMLDSTLFAMKSLTEEYQKIIMQNAITQALKYNYDNKNHIGGLLSGKLSLNLSNNKAKRDNLRSWLLLPNSIDLFEQEINSGNYTIQVNNVRQNIKVMQNKTTLLWIVGVGSFNKVYYFIL